MALFSYCQYFSIPLKEDAIFFITLQKLSFIAYTSIVGF